MVSAETIASRGDPGSHQSITAVDLAQGRGGGASAAPPATTVVLGRQLRPGDVVVGGCGDMHRIDRLAAYPTRFNGPDGASARIAYDVHGSWRRTIADNHRWRLVAAPTRRRQPMPVPGPSTPTGDHRERDGVSGWGAQDEVIRAAAAALIRMHLENLRELPAAHIANAVMQATGNAGLHHVAEVMADLSQAGEIWRVREAVNTIVDSLTETLPDDATVPADPPSGTNQASEEVIGRVRARCLRWIDLTEQGHGAVEYASAAAYVLADLLGIEREGDWSGCSRHCATGHRFDNGCKYRAQLVSTEGRVHRHRPDRDGVVGTQHPDRKLIPPPASP